MSIHHIPYQETGYYSKLICDYLEQKDALKSFYGNFPNLENFKEQIEQKHFAEENREVLVKAVRNQYKSIDLHDAVDNALNRLAQLNTFTVTTGHQLNLFTGPLYFLYKIVSTINLAKQLSITYPEQDFVPVYWMATEDHDFEEINYFNFRGKKIKWNRADIQDNDKGAVGELSTEGLSEVYQLICSEFGTTKMGTSLCNLFEEAYLKHDNLTEATRFLANSLFAAYGLLIVDGNDADLKRVFKPYMKQELLEQKAFDTVQKQAEALQKAGYGVQVNAREINLFYLADGLRERIIEKEGSFFVNDTELKFSKEELLLELENHPERFSPNVIMRPLYQEIILPNLAYIGGGGELAYWLELKSFFDEVEVQFPMLMLRNSALLITDKQQQKLEKLDLSIADLFLDQNDLVNRKIRKISNIDIDFSPQKQHLVRQFEALYNIAEETDASFIGAVKAQEVKQLKGLEHLEKRLLKAQKKKLSDHVKRFVTIQNELFPQENLQERTTNFSEFYLEYGDRLLEDLFESLDPLDYRFTILTK